MGVVISHNWIHDFPKKGLRFDGNGDPMTYNGTMEFNVVWDIEGNREMYPKGENHTITNNVAWDDNEQIDCTLCVPSTGPNSNQIPMNTNTVLITVSVDRHKVIKQAFFLAI